MQVLPEHDNLTRKAKTRSEPRDIARLEQEALSLLSKVFVDKAHGKPALVSSFGSESAVLLHLLSRVAPGAPVLFIDTLMLFEETLQYQVELTEQLGLSGVQRIMPDLYEAKKHDPYGRMHLTDTDSCCSLRKIKPLEDSLRQYDTWVSGRKRFQGETRAQLSVQEKDDWGRVKFNPLADWTAEDIKAYFERHDLPHNPLLSRGYKSIGCSPCTTPVAEGEDPRSGRWRGEDKTECGIHFENGVMVRTGPNADANRSDGASTGAVNER